MDIAANSTIVAFTSNGSLQKISVQITTPSSSGMYYVFVAIYIRGILVVYVPQEELLEVGGFTNQIGWNLSTSAISYGEGGTTWVYLYRASAGFNSSDDFIGTVVIECPDLISKVPLLTKAGYDMIINDLNEQIAYWESPPPEYESIAGWQLSFLNTRKQSVLNFPKFNDFYLDMRWHSLESWNDQLADWTFNKSANNRISYSVYIPKGSSSIPLAFYRWSGASPGIYHPVVSLYKGDQLLTTADTTIEVS
ncbi:MAG: hypothetical protein PHZ19_07765 [Candidatus Thermoplasmatota archaeon]|nr:hypothetical protein [Candidatus Thermoplasmatota archaeon]